MTSYYYSAKKNVFIAAGSTLLKTDAFTDAVPVSNEIFAEFFIGENDGKRRVPGADGLPAWWICPYISRHLLSLNPLQARCRRYSRGER